MLSFYIYKREIQAAFSGILTPNAAVLIAIFAFRLSAGGGGGECHVCQVRWTEGEEEVGEGVSETGIRCQDGILKYYTDLYWTILYTACVLYIFH